VTNCSRMRPTIALHSLKGGEAPITANRKMRNQAAPESRRQNSCAHAGQRTFQRVQEVLRHDIIGHFARAGGEGIARKSHELAATLWNSTVGLTGLDQDRCDGRFGSSRQAHFARQSALDTVQRHRESHDRALFESRKKVSLGGSEQRRRNR